MNSLTWLNRNSSLIHRPLRLKVRKLNPRAAQSTTFHVIVQFKNKLSAARIRALRKRLGNSPLPVTHRLHVLDSIASRVTMTGLRRMCGCKEVRCVYLDGIKKLSLNVVTPSIGSTAVQRQKRLTGKGINVAFIDTGLYPHPDLTHPTNRIVAFKDLIGRRKRPYDDNGHGTHVAGDIAGNGWSSRGKYRGPAPNAGIIAVKAFNRSGDAYDSTIIKALEWCIRNRRRLNLRILSLSFGGPLFSQCSEDPLCQAIEKAVKAGIVVVVAAGNAGPRRRTIESPGNAPSAITVGAVDDRGNLSQAGDLITYYSSRGPTSGGRIKPDLVAPGERVISLRAPGSKQDRKFPNLRVGRRYFVMSGTSVSAPIVAGAAAQLLQKNPSLTPKQVKAILKRNAFRLGLKPNTGGSGEIDMRFLLGRKRKHKRPYKRPARSPNRMNI
ncbi:S8 family peptidase [Paenibacillus paeoniae]|uniref:Peptidase S8 n=1 Tax=Paenibacillus paeoniae TaxID=2292705 RepID=A0A371PIU2_9BACL|nr:S8 family peptidase [Paenibacillus paeoniae]REK75549.1 peptidase S8 [Paenibacillus paeoniae]